MISINYKCGSWNIMKSKAAIIGIVLAIAAGVAAVVGIVIGVIVLVHKRRTG